MSQWVLMGHHRCLKSTKESTPRSTILMLSRNRPECQCWRDLDRRSQASSRRPSVGEFSVSTCGKAL